MFVWLIVQRVSGMCSFPIVVIYDITAKHMLKLKSLDPMDIEPLNAHFIPCHKMSISYDQTTCFPRPPGSLIGYMHFAIEEYSRLISFRADQWKIVQPF